MKTKNYALLFSALSSAFSLSFSQIPDQDASQAPNVPAAVTTPPPAAAPLPPFSYRPLDQLVGESFVFRPMKTLKQQDAGYIGFDFDYNPGYNEYFGRTIKILSIGGSRYFPKIQIAVVDNQKEFTIITQGGAMEAFTYLPDIQAAKAQWLNATLWYKDNSIPCCYQAATDSMGAIPVKKFSPVRVIDVGASWDNTRPIRFTVQTPDGQQGFVDVNVSGINVPRAVRGQNRITDLFYNQDPHTLFNWPANVWSAIDSGNVDIGMTTQQVRMSWGAPKDTSTDGPGRSQWNYASGGSLHFEDDLLTGVDAPPPKAEDGGTIIPDGYPKPDP